ncbi:hypothetical protein CAPTEDRAFT_155251 [Capitella teleta]|uniref:Uncharacterized protein n=1 Tax=Capitella teleta TaxID=283909 RepID=R7TWG4_CAPTE|nr:hypothetical protein CAPTEDRAFT_155251 [Capitella teleta]|eukprot:ELT97932.1 hypothetical protein CAPTEDRAFT_155251 [Capitella teleta]
MLSRASLSLRSGSQLIRQQVSRNFGASAVVAQKASDPIQQLFVDKIREYSKKSKTSGGKLVDANPAVEKELTDEMEKIDRIYGATGPDFLKFPSLKFEDPVLAPTGVNLEVKPEDLYAHKTPAPSS